MTFAELKAELASRGFDYLADDRRGRFINLAMQELYESDLWPFRIASTSGSVTASAPTVSVPDLGPVAVVVNGTNRTRLEYKPWPDALADGVTSDATGTPTHYYVVRNPALVVGVFPAGAATIYITHFQTADDLSAASDDPATAQGIPSRYHGLIVDIAVRMAYRDADNHAAAEAIAAQVERDLLRMRVALGVQNVDGPQDHITLTEPW